VTLRVFIPLGLLLWTVSAGAGTIYLRDGRTIDDVETWWDADGQLYYERYGGAIGIPRGDVIRITGTSKPRQPSVAPAPPARPGPPDAPAGCEAIAAELADVERELSDIRNEIEVQVVEVARVRGGLVKAMGESTLATMRSTESLLDRRRLDVKE
jgi:hypothetical protein